MKRDTWAKDEFYNIFTFFTHLCQQSDVTFVNEIHGNVKKKWFLSQFLIWQVQIAICYQQNGINV